MLLNSGSSSRLFGKSIFPLHVTYLDQNLPYQHPKRSTKQTFFFCHMVSRLVAALAVVDVASRYKEAEPLTSKDSAEVARAFQSIYRRSPLTWPQMQQVDPGREFMSGVTKEMENHKTYIRRGRTEIHRDQAIVERFNRTLAERLFGHQYAVEMLLPEGQ